MPSQYYPQRRTTKYTGLIAAIVALLIPVAGICLYTADPLLARHAASSLAGIIMPLALLAAGIVLNFLPAIISAKRAHPHVVPITISNLAFTFGGGAVLMMTAVLIAPLVLLALGAAWVGLLVWSVWP